MKGSKCKKFTDLYRNELFDEQEQKEKVIKREAFEFRRGTKHLCPDEVQKFREKIRSTIVDSVDDVTVDVLDSISLKHVKGNLDFKEEEFSMEVPKINELKKDYVIADRILEKIRKKNKVDVVKPKQYGRQWLMDRLNGCEDMFDPVITVIESNIDIEDSLVNLLGYDRIELVSELVTNRAVILESLKKPNQQLRPLVRTEADVKVNKKLKREMKGKTFKNERYAQLTTELKRETVIEKVLPLKVIPSYPFVFDSRGAFMQHAGASLALPANASHRIRDTFERIHIPAPANRFQSHPVPKIEIAELNDPILSSVFAHSHLNTIQSTVFNAAYNESNVNLLVCAPTGAGKTNVALLAILNIVKKFTRLPVIDKDAFKIVYVAPMKALAAEMTENFSDRLSKLGDIRVRELTGDMQLTKREMQETQLIVTTPEKWDVITRKITGAEGDDSFVRLVKLIIIDEIHLLQDDRGPVIECIVARTLRQVERYQRPIRIVGLSATLPNYIDVAEFLRVNPYKGLFYFDEGFRPVPLDQTYIGINTSTDLLGRQRLFDEICFQEVLAEVRQNNQVIVFVHSRNSTLRTATYLVDQFLRQKLSIISEAMSGERLPSNIQHRALYNLLQHGVGIHHAGMVRSDRMLVEKLFRRSKTRVLVSTATLAWGINLPAHAVLIKGTEIYESKKGAFVDIGILDVLQIFGRAGRPQFDNRGHGIIITTRDKFQSYIQLAMRQNPIESKLLNSLADWLNAEIVLGTVTSVDEAVRWLSDTYFYVRLLSNPQAYGLTLADLSNDPNLALYRRNVVLKTVNALEEAKMVRFDPLNEYLFATDLGRIASHFYIRYETIELINERMDSVLMTDSDVLDLVANASEFRQLKVRDDETAELDRLYEDECEIPLAKAAQATTGDTKAFVLIQAYMSQAEVKTHSLNADINYVSQNAGRILRALFLIAIKRNRALMASRCLLMARAFQQRCWHFFSPLHGSGSC
ncbi:hypothetical protein ACOME3_005012 [Neoechinorhynchus agilis]